LQEYFGLDNKAMTQLLREIYYEKALDPFIQGASDITKQIYAIDGDRVDAEGNVIVSEAEAATALAVLLLGQQPGGYQDPENPGLGYNLPLIPVYYNGAEAGLDHVIAGLDGYFHAIEEGEGVEGRFYQAGFKRLGIDPSKDILSLPAVTWEGDLGGAVSEALLHGDLETGYSIGMPSQDLEGDILAIALASSGLLDETDSNLSDAIAQMYDTQGVYSLSKYQTFAQEYGIPFDMATGVITQEGRTAFIEKHLANVAAYGMGLYVSDTINPSSLSPFLKGAGSDTEENAYNYAKAALSLFLDEIQRGIQSELGLVEEGS